MPSTPRSGLRHSALKSVLLSLLLTAVGASAASAETWMCRFTRIGMKGWIPKTLELQVDPATGAGRVHDGNTLASYGGPTPVSFVATGDTRYKFKWIAKNLNVDKSMVINTTYYLATLDKASGRVQLAVVIGGRDDRPSGQGKCKRSDTVGRFHTPEKITHRPITFTPMK